MALVLINKPIGHKLTGIEIDANIYDNGTGMAIVYTGTAHGLSDGDYVYIQSDFDEYNGFKYVDSVAYDYFRIKESENCDCVRYIQDAAIQYQVSILDHGFQCVHLPIVYEIESTIYPTNTDEESYSPNTVDSYSDADGNTRLELDQALTDPTELSKIELVGTGPLAGVYQILTVYQPWSVVIDLAYSGSLNFSGYVIVKYYDNYAINVNVYAGLDPSHRWYSEKPYELAATLKFVPDNDNRTKFSIAEILRAYINNRNNLTLDTLPNNLDFMTGFYISYFESYDQSDGEDITTFEGEVTTDDFVGYAINAKLEFKSESISHLSDYLNSGSYLANWLVLNESPVTIAGYFFDLSFILRENRGITVYQNGIGQSLGNPGIGVIRVPIETTEDVCVTVWGDEYETTETENITDFFDLSEFINYSEGLTDWVTGIPQPYVVLPSFQTEFLYDDYATTSGMDYSAEYEFEVTASDPGDKLVQIVFLDNSFLANGFSYITVNGDGTYTGSVDITPSSNGSYLAIRASTGPMTVTMKRVSITYHSEAPVTIPAQQITEEICITVLAECENTFVPDDARLLEDGSFRLLE